MFLVGLTGGIATGKSTVSEYFRQLGCVILDADVIAKEVVQPGTRAWRKIRAEFGDDVILENGGLDRRKLGEIIFADADKRKLLNSFTHPEIYKSMAWKILKLFLTGHSFVILDLPLLFESGQMLPYLTYIIVVSCSEDEQLRRLMKRNQLTEDEANMRIAAQSSLDEKRQRATHVIDNAGSRERTREQVEALRRDLCSSWAAWKIRFALLSVIGLTLSALVVLWRNFLDYA